MYIFIAKSFIYPLMISQPPAMATTIEKRREKNHPGHCHSSPESFLVKTFFRLLLIISCFILFLIFVISLRDIPTSGSSSSSSSRGASGYGGISSSTLQMMNNTSTTLSESESPTNASHLAFGLQGSEKTYHFRKAYVEAWWRPNVTRGYVYLERAPTGDLLPWSPRSPQYRINDDLSQLISEIKPKKALMPRMVHGILELFREEEQGLRWLIMGDDDTTFFVDNLVDVLSKYDHTKYYYIGYPSEFVASNHWFSFNQAFGGGGIILSYPLAKALVNDMDRCLRAYSRFSADQMTMYCLADIGGDLTPHKGVHQNDFVGDYSGFLSSHPKELVLSIHHWDALDPIFPSMDRFQSAEHLMKAGNVDQSRLFQQTICHHRKTSWTFSISWGYSAHIYEKMVARSWLVKPIETFRAWKPDEVQQPTFMFNTRRALRDPCETPHIFFFQSIQTPANTSGQILTVYARQGPRRLRACPAGGGHSAEFVTEIHVLSPPTKRPQVHRSECCDVVDVEEATGKAQVKFRECKADEIIA